MKKTLSILIILLICSCAKRSYKIIDYGQFKITVPEKWNKYERKGIDSYIGGIITDKNDTLKFDLGKYSADVSTDLPMIYTKEMLSELAKKERELLPKTKHLVVEDWTYEGIDIKEYLKYDVEYYTIDCINAKIITPKNKGFGSSGIYIDSLSGLKQNYDKLKFNFYGQYLSDKTQAEFIKALKTLRFEKYCGQHRI
ncbi:hypothetical protein LX77_03859 [Gelidibacter algens]|uniref:Lipoprotein n=1 Tax=Gelidibacter algens TaxID=49280 RepID=A0A1A7QNN6_9FLAO|nr:hypothetical protein [Gelidibacter algens]OBX21086.1 hypothetical protein A9996_18540 [Gelidibacter algens]RAJ17533.1 hypothetical protein LX77_03859 [Gelidibacter algens]